MSSCPQQELSTAPPDVPEGDEKETEEEPVSCTGSQVFSPESRRAIGGAIERTGLKILEQLPVGPQQPNVIISPLSLALALAQLTLGPSELTSSSV